MKKDWEIKTLGELCEIKPPKAEARKMLKDLDFVSFVPMEDLGILEKDFSAPKERMMKDVVGSYTYFSNGDVLMAKITPCFENGKLGIAQNLKNGIGFGSSEFVVFRTTDNLNADYLFYILSSDDFRDEGKKVMSGAVGHKRVPKEYIENYLITLPPLAEQKRIVKILDEKFGTIEELKKVTQQQIAEAKELFESKVSEVFAEHYHQDEKQTLQELSSLITKGSSPKWQGIKYVSETEGILFVTSKNVGIGQLLMEDSTYLEKRFNEIQKRSILQKGDVLTNIVGASIGRTAIYDLEDGANINQAVCIIRCTEKLLNSFLVYLLNSKYFVEILHANEVNNARANLSLAFFSNLEIPKISFKKQLEIVNELDELSEKTKELEAIFRRKIADLEELKKSYLEQAFSGNL